MKRSLLVGYKRNYLAIAKSMARKNENNRSTGWWASPNLQFVYGIRTVSKWPIRVSLDQI